MQYKVISPIRRDGKKIAIGELIDIKESEAASLLENGCIELARLPYEDAALKIEVNLTTK